MNYHAIGTVYTRPEHDENGEPMSEPVVLPGYHVNVTQLTPELEPYRVNPDTPYRVIAGVETYFLRFANREEWLALGFETEEQEE